MELNCLLEVREAEVVEAAAVAAGSVVFSSVADRFSSSFCIFNLVSTV